MKKIIFCLAALFAVFLASCSNDDIEVTQTGGLKINVSTQDVYDQFGLTSDILKLLRTDRYYIRVTTYLYNKDGNLVDSRQEDVQQFNTVRLDFNNVPNGEYTALTIETLVFKSSAKLESPAWNIEDVDKLSSIKIKQKLHKVYYPYVIGVSTDVISVNESTVKSLSPKGIGSLLQLRFLNFDKSSYIDVGFSTDDILDYYLLDPSLERSERFQTDRTSEGHTNVRGGTAIDKSKAVYMTCYVLEKSISFDFSFTMNSDDSAKGTWSHWKRIRGKANLDDGKTYYGGANFIDDNKALDVYFGDIEGFNSWLSSIKTANSPLVPEVYTVWNSSVSEVQAFMTNYNMTAGQAGTADKLNNNMYYILYNGKGKENDIEYVFSNSTHGLYMVLISYNNNVVTETELLKWLNGKYNLVNEINGTYYYKTSDSKISVMLYPYSNQWIVSYYDENHIKDMPLDAPALHTPAQVANKLLSVKLK